tara:strand:- start:1506 stop:1883 length:378 start_codon:yes stop_codon:yes gene_type:complete
MDRQSNNMVVDNPNFNKDTTGSNGRNNLSGETRQSNPELAQQLPSFKLNLQNRQSNNMLGKSSATYTPHMSNDNNNNRADGANNDNPHQYSSNNNGGFTTNYLAKGGSLNQAHHLFRTIAPLVAN